MRKIAGEGTQKSVRLMRENEKKASEIWMDLWKDETATPHEGYRRMERVADVPQSSGRSSTWIKNKGLK